jgi:outer membrane protein OmpA-like peptidoglycan-associated protein
LFNIEPKAEKGKTMFTSTLQNKRLRPSLSHSDHQISAPFFMKSGGNGMQKNAEQPFFTQTASNVNVQKKDTGCADYEGNEIEKSHTQKGILNSDAFIPGFMSLMNRQNDLVISDFGVDWGSVKESTRNEPFLQQWIYSFENNPEYRLEIEGYSDCSGFEQHNHELRQRRASKVYQIFDKARPRVKFYKSAPVDEYLTGNENKEGRAVNRGVAIHFERSFDFTSETIEGNRPKPPKPKSEKAPEKADTTDCDTNQKNALTRALNRAQKMLRAALGEIDNDTLLKKYFGKDALKHRYHIKQNLVSIKDGLNAGPTFECEKSDSFWCDDAVAMVIPIAGLNIHICPSAINKGDDFLARTIVHEAGHRYAFIFSPDDLCEGGWPADRDTTDAEDNADCYGEFAGDAFTI